MPKRKKRTESEIRREHENEIGELLLLKPDDLDAQCKNSDCHQCHLKFVVEDLNIKKDEHSCSLLEEIKFALTKTPIKIRQGKPVSATERILATGNLTDDLVEELKEEGKSSEKFRLLLDVLA